MQITSRAEAKSLGSSTYFTGKPCSRGHLALRHTYNCACLDCVPFHNRNEYVRRRSGKPPLHDRASRKAAKAQGDRTYYTGLACPKGHIAERLTHNGECVECKRIGDSDRAKRTRIERPDLVREYARRGYQNHKEEHKARGKRWALANPDKKKAMARRWRTKNRVPFAKMVREWRHKNPGRVRLQKFRRKVLETAAAGEFSPEDVMQLLFNQDARCRGCQCDITETFTIDHDLPLSRGGSNAPENLQLLCLSCNSAKGTKTMREWSAMRTALIG